MKTVGRSTARARSSRARASSSRYQGALRAIGRAAPSLTYQQRQEAYRVLRGGQSAPVTAQKVTRTYATQVRELEKEITKAESPQDFEDSLDFEDLGFDDLMDYDDREVAGGFDYRRKK